MNDLTRRQLIGYLVAGAIVVLIGAWWVRGGARGDPAVRGQTVQLLGDSTTASADATGLASRGVTGASAADSPTADTSGSAGSAGSAGSGGSVDAASAAGGDTGEVIVHVAGAVRRPGVYALPASARVATAIRRAGGAHRGANLDAVNLAAKVVDGRQILVPRRSAAGSSVAAAGSAGAADPAAASDPSATAAPAEPVNLNTATLEQLGELDGVGPVTAQKILDYRRQHGGFTAVEELDAIDGIGPKRLATLRAQVTL